MEAFGLSPENHVVATRGRVFEDAVEQLGPAVFRADRAAFAAQYPDRPPPGDLRGIVRVRFLNQHGVEEPGVDGGGLFKDFLGALVAEAETEVYGEKIVRVTKEGETRMRDRFSTGDILVLTASYRERFMPRECCVVDVYKDGMTLSVGPTWPAGLWEERRRPGRGRGGSGEEEGVATY